MDVQASTSRLAGLLARRRDAGGSDERREPEEQTLRLEIEGTLSDRAGADLSEDWDSGRSFAPTPDL